ncbi:class IIb bacteriocin, lactobin A/cerein 7B family [Mitsuaria sp. GD03876]|uniref:class IIb bacteriocin, lactobin A/cerein 7B family n=1 Tax=Mitsuaria sp. GD03876 TaxID=2975399 RepID=UPI0024470775|nr:class IIb bacteriocin, lactobin A/cerein 7B family [Mitsuaria sp. GD03876]MDH0867456.1 class IIb bacteriocin, lactobin A/cerein 7B family [Mitsuaria sp. GD03876]
MTAFIANPTPVHAGAWRADAGEPVGIQELTLEEIEQVHGGFGPAGALAGAVGAGVGSYLTGGNAGQVAAAAIFGGVAGFFCGVGMYASSATVAAMGTFATSSTNRYTQR